MSSELKVLTGKVYTLFFCKNSEKSLNEALSTVKHPNIYLLDMQVLLQKLADGEKLKEVVSESDKSSNIKFWAIKKIPIRCYFWYSKTKKRHIYVSHFVHKKQQKLAKKDKERVYRNHKAMESNK